MTMPRVVEINSGITMVVTDLHGDWPLYARYRDVFLELRAQGLAQTLVITGDFIHSNGGPGDDRSLDIVLDMLTLKETLGDALLVLLGNHELPHIYHIPLAKGDQVFTPSFEQAMQGHREEILDFFAALPFYIRTQAGVAICHAGAFPGIHTPGTLERLWNYSHHKILAETTAKAPPARRPSLRARLAKLSGVPYEVLSQQFLDISGPEDPRFDEYLIGALANTHADFNLLWEAFFSQNEKEKGEAVYANDVRALLRQLSQSYTPQKALIAGHIGCRNGYRVLADGQQLRLASGAHAHPYRAARYLLFDAGKPVTRAEDLLEGLGSIF